MAQESIRHKQLFNDIKHGVISAHSTYRLWCDKENVEKLGVGKGKFFCCYAFLKYQLMLALSKIPFQMYTNLDIYSRVVRGYNMVSMITFEQPGDGISRTFNINLLWVEHFEKTAKEKKQEHDETVPKIDALDKELEKWLEQILKIQI